MGFIDRVGELVDQHLIHQEVESEESLREREHELEAEILNDGNRLGGFEVGIIEHNYAALMDLRRHGLPRGRTLTWFPSSRRALTQLVLHHH